MRRPVRARALALLISRLARAGVVAHADRLDYNLATLDVRLHRVTLATSAVPETPFLTADDVHATLGWGILLGRINVTLLEVAHPRIVLVRNARGRGELARVGPAVDRDLARFFELGRVRHSGSRCGVAGRGVRDSTSTSPVCRFISPRAAGKRPARCG